MIPFTWVLSRSILLITELFDNDFNNEVTSITNLVSQWGHSFTIIYISCSLPLCLVTVVWWMLPLSVPQGWKIMIYCEFFRLFFLSWPTINITGVPKKLFSEFKYVAIKIAVRCATSRTRLRTNDVYWKSLQHCFKAETCQLKFLTSPIVLLLLLYHLWVGSSNNYLPCHQNPPVTKSCTLVKNIH